jgi:hypothetical protein
VRRLFLEAPGLSGKHCQTANRAGRKKDGREEGTLVEPFPRERFAGFQVLTWYRVALGHILGLGHSPGGIAAVVSAQPPVIDVDLPFQNSDTKQRERGR